MAYGITKAAMVQMNNSFALRDVLIFIYHTLKNIETYFQNSNSMAYGIAKAAMVQMTNSFALGDVLILLYTKCLKCCTKKEKIG